MFVIAKILSANLPIWVIGGGSKLCSNSLHQPTGKISHDSQSTHWSNSEGQPSNLMSMRRPATLATVAAQIVFGSIKSTLSSFIPSSNLFIRSQMFFLSRIQPVYNDILLEIMLCFHLRHIRGKMGRIQRRFFSNRTTSWTSRVGYKGLWARWNVRCRSQLA